jgi:hypothetical protein
MVDESRHYTHNPSGSRRKGAWRSVSANDGLPNISKLLCPWNPTTPLPPCVPDLPTRGTMPL